MQVNKVAGNFHFAAGHSYQQGSMHIHDMAPFSDKTLDFSHTIHTLSFGKPYPVSMIAARAAIGTSALPQCAWCTHVLAGCLPCRCSMVL